MQKRCKVCEIGVGIPWWRPVPKSSVYCSKRCSIIGNAKHTFGVAVFLGIAAIGLIIADIVIVNLPVLLIIGAMAGLLAIILSIFSALGFYFKRQDGY